MSECYVKMGRVDEVMDRHKSLCSEIGKDSMDSIVILQFASRLLEANSEISHALEILMQPSFVMTLVMAERLYSCFQSPIVEGTRRYCKIQKSRCG